MDRPLSQALEHAALAERHPFDGAVVRQHGDDRIAPAGVRHLSRRARSPIDEPLRPARRAVVDGDLVAGLKQASRHAGAHVPEADESDCHASDAHRYSSSSPLNSEEQVPTGARPAPRPTPDALPWLLLFITRSPGFRPAA